MNEANPMLLIREAIGLASNLADELVRMEAEGGEFWSGDDFYIVVSSFVSSIKQYRGIEIEEDSPGSKLANAIERHDKAEMSRHRFEIMSNLKALSGTKRGGYMFFAFWPKLHLALTASQD